MRYCSLTNISGIATLLLFGLAWLPVIISINCYAQKPDSSRSEIRPIERGTRIWTGTAGVTRNTHYFLYPDENRKIVQTYLDFNIRRIHLLNRFFGWGVQGTGNLYMEGTFGFIGLGSIGLGPIIYVYPWQGERWMTYVNGNFLAGYNIELASSLGAERSDGMRYRFGLRGGLSYRVSDAFAIFLELGPDWEADERFVFDSRAKRLDFGIQLYRF